MWFRKKKLFELDPKILSLELLSRLQASLLAKLILVNNELMSRYRNLSELSDGLPDADTNASLFSKSADELRGFNLILNQILSQNIERS